MRPRRQSARTRQRSARTTEPPPATERRLVSVLFADLVGFTTLSESRDSEEVRELLSRYFDTCRTIVDQYGGVIEKFIGDAVMAIWGAPVAKEDDAERAVRAALELVDAVSALGVEVGAKDLQARAGVLTGEAAVNLGQGDQGMVAGDLVNTSSRIQSAAEPGTALVGEATRRATEASIAYADAGTHVLKGKAEPMRLWRALRVTAGMSGLMKSEGLEPPFVGRELELRLVKDLFHSCVNERKAHLVQVTGIAGIGKSRLSWEFFKYMDGLESTYFWHRGRCLSYGEGVTYWALAEMVRGRAEILEAEDRQSAQAKLRAMVETYIPDAEERRFVEPRLAHLVGLEDRTAPDKTDLFAGWRLFFERLTEHDPVLMVFEDLQWADPSLLEFLDYLLQWSRGFPLFVLTLARPEGAGTDLAATRRNATSISLEPLPEASMEELLTGFAPGLEPELNRRILERAEGVPLYAVETVRMLLDRGLLVQEGAVYRPVGAIADLDVPETLHALIAARLDGLTPEERRLIQDAAVLGKTFSRVAIAALSSQPEGELDQSLRSLVSKEVLSVQADPRSPERGQYGFLQDLVRTVAYETLAKKDRKTRHLQVATYLEDAWGGEEEEIVEVVASHYLEAFSLAPEAEDAPKIRDRARRMLVRAAERAASLAAAEEAEAYFHQAAELTDSSVEQAELKESAGRMAWLRGRAEEATASFEAATELFTAADQTHPAARVQAQIANIEWAGDHLEQATERMSRAYAVLSGDEPDADVATVAAQLGRFLALSERTEEAMPLLEEALELAETFGIHDVYASALNSKAVAIMPRGRLHESATLLREALDVSLRENLSDVTFRSYNNLGVALESLDRWEEAVERGEESIEYARRTGDRGNELYSVLGMIGALTSVGRWDDAVARAEEGRAAVELSSLEVSSFSLLELVLLHVHRGDLEAAAQELKTLEGAATSEQGQYRALHAMARAQLLRARGENGDALAAAEEALAGRERYSLFSTTIKRAFVEAVEAALTLGDVSRAEQLLGIVETARPGEVPPFLRSQAARLAARLAATKGVEDPVEPGFAAAERGFRELKMPFELAVTLLEHAEWRATQGSDIETFATEAHEIFDRLGAKPWLERLSRLPTPASLSQT